MKLNVFFSKCVNHLAWRINGMLDKVLFVPHSISCKLKYHFAEARIRHKISAGEKVKVFFIIDSITKWKAQSLYDEMKKSKTLDPVMVIARPDPHELCGGCKDSDARRIFETNKKWFLDRGMSVIEIYDIDHDKSLDLAKLGADIVFYPQSWYSVSPHLPRKIAGKILTCYIPYSVPNYCDIDIYTRIRILPMLWRHFVLNEMWADMFAQANRWRFHAVKFIGVGHPMLDGVHFQDKKPDKPCIIYAPHWTVKCKGLADSLRYSTFTDNGAQILAYAKAHPEFEWVFKPHPCLKMALVQNGLMTEAQAAEYYDAWNKLGSCFDSAGYEALFNRSCAMITDCGSFLVEYAVTGNPIIHLLSSESKLQKIQPAQPLFDTYYKVRNLDEMYATFKLLFEQNKDPKRDERLTEIRKANLLGNNAAKNIVEYLNKELGVKGE